MAAARGICHQAHREVDGEARSVAAAEMCAVSMPVGDRHGSHVTDGERRVGILVGHS
jgi:hypothetical protein